jgi:hypothetical protein
MLDRSQLKSVVQVPVAARAETRKNLIPVFRSYVKDKVGPEGSAALEQALGALKLQ